MEFNDIEPAEITFQKQLFSSSFSVIFLVTIRNMTCVMKVLDIQVLESTAYRRLKAYGVCDRGLVPDFFGSIRKFDPAPYQPHLKILKEIHRALVLHDDPKPRNMMVVKDDPERVVWLDFDRAETFDEDLVTDEERQYLDEETEMVACFQRFLQADCKKGKLDQAYIFYCT
ncbi:hypothetical protein BO94DRAFT_561108 [Aspergillus sclerotioniger CBS 115572]|uniref:Protein kinase domain-containing protein n=1 Tax=Aspergillus sclerotioniger CBS 115572 TaxID=1450535 RepID=A0A317V442_9EURO|nr:hypothetical protein BO94DRAFT_561108 [Aspergillus sclerotioniger CBS 115572]PWY67607.1 hypothetical protein BO94DRAFT_561108 [Aspergillus sclerotioniger CBS 115572]